MNNHNCKLASSDALVPVELVCHFFHEGFQVQGGDYSHVLHGRYRDRAALKAYYAHVDIVNIQMKLLPMIEDRLVVDWECIPCGPYLENIGAKRITLLKFKEGISAQELKFLEESIQLLPSK